MKTVFLDLKSIIYILISLIVAIVGVIIGSETYRYDVIVKGGLGAINLIFLYLFFLSPKSSYVMKHIGNTRFDFPKDLLDLFPILFVGIIVSWSFKSVFTVALLFFNYIIKN
jgi:membrane associated rhomboid family serine protease